MGRYINADQVDFGVTVLARLGGTHIDNLPKHISRSINNPGQGRARGRYLAGTSLDEDVATLAKSRALHGETGARSAITSLDKAAKAGVGRWGEAAEASAV
jgi:hypothetical protein